MWKYCNPYVSRVPDLLHHYYLGLLKKSLKSTLQLLRSSLGGDDLVGRLDKAVCEVGIRDLKTFKPGILDVAGLKGWEYVDICFLMIHALYEVQGPEENVHLFACLAETLLRLRLGTYHVPSSPSPSPIKAHLVFFSVFIPRLTIFENSWHISRSWKLLSTSLVYENFANQISSTSKCTTWLITWCASCCLRILPATVLKSGNYWTLWEWKKCTREAITMRTITS